jgi:hypothetical protein
VDRSLVCDCGFVATSTRDADVVAVAYAHAVEAHGIELSARLLRLLADRRDDPRR